MIGGTDLHAEMTDRAGPDPAQPRAGPADPRADGPQRSGPSAGRLPGRREPDRRQQRRWVPALAGWLALLIGLADIMAGLSPERFSRLHHLAEVTNLTRTADIIIGLLLVMLSHGLRRRKRRAWEAVAVLLASSLLLHYALRRGPPHLASTLVTAALLVALLSQGRQFYAVGDARSRWRALWVLCFLAAADVAIGLAYLAASHGLAASYTLAQRVQSAVWNLVGFSGPVRFVTESESDHFGFLTGALGFFTLAVVGYFFLRPAEPSGRLRDQDAERIRQLLDCHGERDSLGYFALRHDKSVIWSPTDKSCICYRVLSGVILAAGDPIGDPEAWPGAIHAFLDEAARHAWVPAVIGCSELGAEVWCREGGLTALELGDEAVVSVADFTTQGRAMRNVRQMVKRVCRQGYLAQVRRAGDIPAAEIAELIRQADSWRGSPTERGFSMALGRVACHPDDDRCVIATATENGMLRAVLHFVPWGSDGLSLDLMRRDRAASPGLNDFLIVETIKNGPDLGVKRISLNFAVFRAALERGERIGAGPVMRAWRGLLLFMSRWFQIESLYKFNAKFSPQWVPRFLVFPHVRDAPRISLAALEAEAFLVWPTTSVRRIARQAGLGRLRRRAPGWAAAGAISRQPGP